MIESQPVRILLADRDSGRCARWINEFAKLPDLETVRCLDNLEDLRSMNEDLWFDAIVVNAAYPPSEIHTAIEWMRRNRPASHLMVLGVPEESVETVTFFESGAWAVLSDRATVSELAQCLRAAARGEAPLSPPIAGRLLRRIRQLSLLRVHEWPDASAVQSLTRREREILNLIAHRLDNQEIGRELVIEVGTVKNHVHSLLKKLGVANRYEAAAFALEAAREEVTA